MAEQSRYEVDAYRLDAYIPERLVEEAFGGRDLLKLAVRKFTARLGRRPRRDLDESVASVFAGVAVLDRPGQEKGGLAGGRDFPRVLNELGIGRRPRLYEFCAGPGYIGYSLLAAGWCETLALSDIDPGAVRTARRTAALNGIEDRVSVFESDVLDRIPSSKRWDLVVGNPPHFLPDPDQPENIQRFDPDWEVHRRFYSSVKEHMEPGGLVVMFENNAGADADLFARMIGEGGGRLRCNHPGTRLDGQPNGAFFQVSEW